MRVLIFTGPQSNTSDHLIPPTRLLIIWATAVTPGLAVATPTRRRPLSGCRSSDIGLSRRHGLSRRRRICRLAWPSGQARIPIRAAASVRRPGIKDARVPRVDRSIDAHPWNDHAERHCHDDQQGGAGVGECGRQQLRWRVHAERRYRNNASPPCGTGRRPELSYNDPRKANAANGNRRRLATGVAIVPTNRQATSAPTWTLVPATAIATQRKAWASMPMATGTGSIRQGMAKNEPNAENGNAGGDHIIAERRGRRGAGNRQVCPTKR